MADAEGKEPKPDDEGGLGSTKRDFIQTFFKRAGEFTDDLLRENERLRFRVLQLEEGARGRAAEVAPSSGTLRELAARIEQLEHEREQLLQRVHFVASENLDFEQRAREIERENNNLANLYVASYQLHSTVDLRELTQIVVEILLNFVGARTFAVLLLDEPLGVLRPLAAEGIARAEVPPARRGEGVVGAAVATGRPHVDPAANRSARDLARPMIVTPLRIQDRVVGAIVIWDLLPQKTELAEVDSELFNLLAAHAATALQGAKLASELGGRAVALWDAVDLV
ncbi:MAG: GAF domain-containing protein [Myxococcales bacterium]|nr:GAF domain-containing protein [Myxococcales bacterium]